MARKELAEQALHDLLDCECCNPTYRKQAGGARKGITWAVVCKAVSRLADRAWVCLSELAARVRVANKHYAGHLAGAGCTPRHTIPPTGCKCC